jgi:hypothetical protein
MAKEYDRDSNRTSVAAVGDGVDDRIDIPNDTCSFNTASGNITVCFWTRPDNDTREVAVEIADPIETFIQKNPPARRDRMTINTFDGNKAVFADAPFTVGQLDHFAFMHTNNELRAFKNGQRVTTTPAPDSITRSQDLALFDGPGRRFSSPEYEGLLDDVRIYQGGLSDAEIRQIYRQTRPEQPVAPVASESLVAWYPFRRNSALDHTSLVDIPVGDRTAYDATVNGATYKPSGGVTDIQTGANSGAFEFDGTDDDLQPQNDSGLNFGTNSFSISLAVQVDNFNSPQPIYEKNANNKVYQQGINSNKEVATAISEGDSVAGVRVPMNTTSFIRVTTVRDAQARELRVFAGSNKGSASESGFDLTNSGQLFIGHDDSTATRFDGVLDDIRFYDTALTQSQHDEIRSNTIP